ncbi:MAG: hypothetical protein QXD60_02725 [Nanopusillaceae archaeon]
MTLTAIEELLTWHTEPVLQVFVADGQGGSVERRVTFPELLRMDGGGKAAMERIAALKALLELISVAPEGIEDTKSDRAEDIIMRILERHNISLIPPPRLSDNSTHYGDPA